MRLSILMLCSLPLTFALPSSYTSHPIRRAADLANEVLSEITALNSSVAGLTSAVNAFDGSLLGVLPQSLAVITAEGKLDTTTLKATAIAKQSANFTADESTQIVEASAGLITPITDSLNAISAKYETFKSTLESPIVLLDLKTLKSHTNDFITALIDKVPESDGALLGLGNLVIDEAFDSAIAAYEG